MNNMLDIATIKLNIFLLNDLSLLLLPFELLVFAYQFYQYS